MRLLAYVLITVVGLASLAYGFLEVYKSFIIYKAQGECISTYVAQGIERAHIRRTDTWCEVARPE